MLSSHAGLGALATATSARSPVAVTRRENLATYNLPQSTNESLHLLEL